MPADVFSEFVENDEWIEEDEDKSFLFGTIKPFQLSLFQVPAG